MIIDAQRRRFNRSKRILDISVIALASPLLLVAGIVAGIAAGAAQGRPLVFRQDRIGLGGKRFELLKLRTMTEARDSSGNLLPDEQRLTKVGRALRKTSLDELPQIVNVVRGDMSLIGPRPLLVDYLPFYRAHEHARHTVRPGVTGLAQVSGRNGLLWDERLKLDAKYASDARVVDDAKIFAHTVKQVCMGSDVSIVAGESGERLDVVRSYPSEKGYALRRLEFTDVPTRVDWFHSPGIRQHMKLPHDVSLESTMGWLRTVRRDSNRHDFVVYNIDNGRLVAMLGIRRFGTGRLPDLYILVAPDRGGEGLGSVSMSLLLKWMRRRSDLAGCHLTVGKDNVAAVKLYEKFGFSVIDTGENGDRLTMEAIWEVSE